MKTSYYAKFNRLADRDKYIPIAISVGVPSWFQDDNFKVCYEFRPPYDIVVKKKNNTITEEEFEDVYNEHVLNCLDPNEAYDYFMGLEESLGKEVVFLCYETSDKFCHRHIVSRWFKEQLDICVDEL